jgi:hypothetical protein
LASAHACCTPGRPSTFARDLVDLRAQRVGRGAGERLRARRQDGGERLLDVDPAKSWSVSRWATRSRITGCPSSSVLVRVQLSVLSTWRRGRAHPRC